MTACTNNGGKARRVVTAALVGVLSVGTVPMAALAEGVSDGIQTLALNPADAFSNGTLTAEDGQGGSVTFPEKDDVAFEAGSGKYLLPTAITIEGETIDFDLSKVNGNVSVLYKQNNQAVAYAGNAVFAQQDNSGAAVSKVASDYNWTSGTYTMVVTYHKDGSQYDGMSKTVTFRIVDTNLSDAVVFNASDSNTDVTKNTFTYNGKAQKIGLAVDGVALEANEYDLKVVKDGKDVTDTGMVGAGDYIVNVYKKDADVSKVTPVKSIKVTVAKLNLSTASVSISDATRVSTAISSCMADNVQLTNGVDVDITLNVDSSQSQANMVGSYTAMVAPKDTNNIEGSATVTFNKVTEVVNSSNFTYNGTPFASLAAPNAANTLNVDLSDPTTLFSEKKIGVTGCSSKDFDIWYTDEDGNAATAADLQTKGTWKVNVRVNAERTNYAKGSDTQTLTVRVTGGTVASSDIVFKYKGEVCADLTGTSALTYDGSDVLDSLETVVRSGDKTLTEGTDYTVKVVNKSTNKEVDKIVDAGTYTVSIESDAYDINSDNKIEIQVKALNLDNAVYAKSPLMQSFGQETLIPYTGSEIDPSLTFGYYTGKDGKVCTDTLNAETAKDYTWHELPAGTVKVNDIKFDTKSTGSFATAVDALKDKGFYKLELSLGKDVKNYEYTTGNAKNVIEVSDQGVFADVSNSAWYSQAVYTAKVNEYVNGFAGTQLFGPEQSITRADVACILFNMGGGSVTVGSDQWDENVSYVTKFNDVDKNAYYAQAIGWAARFGIVNGYEGSFRPTDEVTREEFAAMLCNYAKAMGKFTASDGSALAALSDGANVSDWAKESVAWAVENGVMGNGGYVKAHDDITRAEVAAMAVNYQPEPLTTGFLGDKPANNGAGA